MSNGTKVNHGSKRNRVKSSSKKTSRTTSRTPRRPSSVFYKNDSDRCAQITSKGERCPKSSLNGGNYCQYHETMRQKKVKEHADLIRKRGGTVRPKVFEYNYYLDEDIEPFDSNASLVTNSPPIWIGSIDSIHDMNFLKNNKVKSIINASGMEPTPNARDMYRKLGVDYYTLSDVEKVPNHSHYRVSRYLGDEKFSKNGLTPREFFKFMHKGVQMMNQKGFKFPAIINCHAGMNRSASLITAYLITKPRPYSYEKTVDMLKKANRRRNLDVLTNSDFRKGLKYFPLFMGTAKGVSPQLMARYKHYLSSYEL